MDSKQKLDIMMNYCTNRNFSCHKCPIKDICKEYRGRWEGHDDVIDRAFSILAIAGHIFAPSPQKIEAQADDPVNHPGHYTKGGIECLDAIRASMTDDGFLDFLKGQIIKYVWRYQHKGKPLEDLQKARFYLNRMIDILEGGKDHD
jgi:hypothetical protein